MSLIVSAAIFMPSGHESYTSDDTLLYFAGLLITKMRVLSADPVLKCAEELVSRMRIVRRCDNTTLSEGAAVDEAYPFIVMPRDVWIDELRRSMRRLAGKIGLTIKLEHRYDLPRSQVCLRIVRNRRGWAPASPLSP